ncbi:Transcriptional regulator [Mucor velutinosus]|uniref:Transcriptional regulator n=1 Tax=Mucor velutinosus TaxID=708070 RepID=A0AAN7DH63_9FUNG|nr:Transcriptional regulator [Mucor velutinosus]
MAEHPHLQSFRQTTPFLPVPHHHDIADHDQHHEARTTEDSQLVCRWNQCLKVFSNHTTLADHLSEDHIGWKKGGYSCDWDNCSRQGAKCHNRFALIMHLRIHTGEKPFECKAPDCGQTFGRMDALTRHKKAEHGEGVTKKLIKPAHSANIIPLLNTPTAASAAATTISSNHTPSSSLSTIPPLNNKQKKTNDGNINTNNKRMATPSLDMLSKNKRHKVQDEWYSKHQDIKLSEQASNVATAPTSTLKKDLNRGTAYSQYRLAKAQLAYILRENEMLQDEYEITQKKLKRMKTERRVLLDALMNREMEQQDEEVEVVDEEEEEEEDIQEDLLSHIKAA